jgi:hypothetical protein
LLAGSGSAKQQLVALHRRLLHLLQWLLLLLLRRFLLLPVPVPVLTQTAARMRLPSRPPRNQ